MDHDVTTEQANEVEALQAIYGKDYESRPGVWKCPAFAIRVRPVGISLEQAFALITLIVKVTLITIPEVALGLLVL